MIKQLPRARIKSKTVQRDGIELTVELRIRESDVDFVDKFLRVQGVFDATLVAHQGDLISYPFSPFRKGKNQKKVNEKTITRPAGAHMRRPVDCFLDDIFLW